MTLLRLLALLMAACCLQLAAGSSRDLTAEEVVNSGLVGVNFTEEADYWWPAFRDYLPIQSKKEFEAGLKSLSLGEIKSLNDENFKATNTYRNLSDFLKNDFLQKAMPCYVICNDNTKSDANCTEHKNNYKHMNDWVDKHRTCVTTNQQRETSNVTLRHCYHLGKDWACKGVQDGMLSWGRTDVFIKLWETLSDELTFVRIMVGREPTQLLAGLSLMSVFSVLGLIGNILVIIVANKSVEFRSVTSIYLANLAFADLLFILLNIYLELIPTISLINGKLILFSGDLHQFFCGLPGQLRAMCYASSAFTLIAIGFERFIVITLPMKAKAWCTRGKAKIIIIVTWILALILSQTEHVKWTVNHGNLKKLTCSEVDMDVLMHWLLLSQNTLNDKYIFQAKFVLGEFIVLFLIPMVCLVLLYGSIAVALLKSIKQAKQLTGVEQNENDKESNAKEKRKNADALNERIMLVRVMITVVIVFVICQAPLRIVSYLHKAIWTTSSKTIIPRATIQQSYVVVKLMSAIGPALNPILYTFTSRNFRRGTVMLFASWLHIEMEPTGEFQTRTIYSIKGLSQQTLSSQKNGGKMDDK